MKYTNKLLLFLCLGMSCIILWGFSACDFQPTKELLYGRPVGGSLAGGATNGTEFIEDGGSSGSLSKNLLHSGDITLPPLSKHEIREMLDATDSKHLPSDPTHLYDVLPNYTAPYNAGKIKQEYLDLTLARLNALRRFSGLPAVVMTDEYNDIAQHGAALMVITQNFEHGKQPQPDGMESDFYEKGTKGTAEGNIYPQYPLIACIDGYNLDPGNPGVGHRLWQMSPGLQAVGIGSAIKKKDDNGNEIGLGGNVELVAYTKAPAGQEPKPFDWKFVSYPSSGYFPLRGSLFGNPASWSIKLNTNHYAKIGDKANEVPAKDVAVSLIRTSDGATWKFFIDDDTEILKIGDLLVYNCDPGHFIPGGDTIIFRILKENPEHPGDPNKRIDHPYKDGEIYQVQVHGLKDKSGNPVDFAFETKFFTP